MAPARIDGAATRDAVPGLEEVRVALLTGGSDKPYAFGLASGLGESGVQIDFVGSDELDCPQIRQIRGISFLNFRGDQGEDAPLRAKVGRILRYYWKLIAYAATSQTKILHILWNNKFELFDRTLLILYYRIVGKRVVLTAHNVNGAKRDNKDSPVNRLSLMIQYGLSHAIFVHTELMKRELASTFRVDEKKVVVIPFGINNTYPNTVLASADARARLGLPPNGKVLLFFGQIAPYKGLEYLISAAASLEQSGDPVRVLVAGRVKKGYADYWAEIQRGIASKGIEERVVQRIQFIPDEDVEIYFKAADAVVIPYTDIFQSGVPFLAYSFGLPVIASDVGSLREDVVEGRTGFMCQPRDSADLASTIRRYFSSDLYRNLESNRSAIREFANERYSWNAVAGITRAVYTNLLRGAKADAGRAEPCRARTPALPPGPTTSQ